LADVRICDQPAKPDLVQFREGTPQRFLVTVDTEEEFDWSAPLNRHGHRTDAIPALNDFLEFCEDFGIVPVFLVDYPIATSQIAADVLGPAIAAGKAEIGVQLHPWVSPPHDEIINPFNSFAGNLPAELERAKFRELRDTIERNFGTPPLIYRAGRYGTGPNTAAILSECGIAIDTSVRSSFDYSSEGGPNYNDHPVVPYWLDRPAGLMELPLTTAYWGLLRHGGRWLYPRLWRAPRLRGLLARMAMLDRIPLTPEGVSSEEAIRGIDLAIDDGLPLLVFSFHSPSLVPGNTPYVTTPEQLDQFYDWWRQVFTHLARRNIKPTCVRDILQSVALA
jgi:hypothetical protein